MEVCLPLVFLAIIIILIVAQELSGSTSSPRSSGVSSSQKIGSQNPDVRITGRDELTGWALHKHPQELSGSTTLSRSSGGSSSHQGIGSRFSNVRITGRDDLTSWALHKYPQDIDTYDYWNISVLDADVVIHRDSGVNKVVKGPGKGRILTDREVEEYQQQDRHW